MDTRGNYYTCPKCGDIFEHYLSMVNHWQWCQDKMAAPAKASQPPETPAPAAPLEDKFNPSYYKTNGMESIEVIEAFNLGFHLGNVVKYVLRAGKKDSAIDDLKKARWYLDRKISQLERG